jgi:hypothetical protein
MIEESRRRASLVVVAGTDHNLTMESVFEGGSTSWK